MSMFQQLTCGELAVNKVPIVAGTAATQAAIYAERAAISQMGALDADPIGTLYIGAGVVYQRVAKAGAAADWYKVTMTNA